MDESVTKSSSTVAIAGSSTGAALRAVELQFTMLLMIVIVMIMIIMMIMMMMVVVMRMTITMMTLSGKCRMWSRMWTMCSEGLETGRWRREKTLLKHVYVDPISNKKTLLKHVYVDSISKKKHS